MTDFPTVSYMVLTCEMPTWSLWKVPLLGGALLHRPLKGVLPKALEKNVNTKLAKLHISLTVFDCLQACFKDNLINGRKLITVDASSLPRMGITDFEHIKVCTKIKLVFKYWTITCLPKVRFWGNGPFTSEFLTSHWFSKAGFVFGKNKVWNMGSWILCLLPVMVFWLFTAHCLSAFLTSLIQFFSCFKQV